jgi:hypothetical protein
MNKHENMNKLVDEALSSVDDIKRAEVKPFLLTRINARMNKGTESVWEKAGWFISRPAVAFAGLCMIILINIMVVLLNGSANSGTVTEQTAQSPADEFSYTVATIYDTENTQP